MENKRYVMRLIRHEGNMMVNICDEELLGKTLKDKDLEIHISQSFYGNNKINLKEAIDIIQKSHSINLVGNRIVEEALNAKLASKLSVKKIGSTLFLMIIKFNN